MATIRVPDEVPSAAQDSETLNQAFRGTLPSVSAFCVCGYLKTICIVCLCRMGNRREGDHTRLRKKKQEPKKDNQRELQRDLRQRSYRCSHL